MKKRTIYALLAGVMALSLLAGCSNGTAGSGKDNGQDKKPVTIVATDNGWDSQRIHTTIAKLVVEHAYDGYTLETSGASSSMNWLSMINGDIDLDIESWTDNVATYADDVAKGDIVNLGVLVPDSLQGLYVPRYVIEGDPARGIEPAAPDLKTVKDLLKYADLFPDDETPSKGRLYGGLAGWMADEVMSKKYEAYGLDDAYTYVRLGTEGALFASLESAYNLGQPWVGYCYEPTVIAGKLDLVRLTDEPYNADTFADGLCDFPAQELKIVSSRNFADRAPELVPFFQKYQTGSAIINEALVHYAESKDFDETAIWVLKTHDDLLDQWLPADRAAQLRDYLSTVD